MHSLGSLGGGSAQGWELNAWTIHPKAGSSGVSGSSWALGVCVKHVLQWTLHQHVSAEWVANPSGLSAMGSGDIAAERKRSNP